MSWRNEFVPAAMERVAVVAPEARWRRVLVELGDLGRFEPDKASTSGPIRLAAERAASGKEIDPRTSVDTVDPTELERAGDLELLLGEAEIEDLTAAAVPVGRSRVLPGWVRSVDAGHVREAIEPFGGAVVELVPRRGLMAPTAQSESRAGEAFRPLVKTYATVPSRDLDPTLFAAIAYMVMFGMMFGDVAHGLAIVAIGLVAMITRREDALGRAAPFLIGAGIAAAGFGLLYGEAFGPTGIVPTVWLRPLDEPETLLVAGLGLGGVLLALSFVMSIANRWREGGPGLAVYEPSGIAGALLLLGAGAAAMGSALDRPGWWRAGLIILVVGTLLAFVGLIVNSGSGLSGVAQAVVELFDTLLRLGSNIVSFTRLAAFGLTHAVISEVVWDGTSSLWSRGGVLTISGAVLLFALGNLAAFALGALVGAIQALRLEYYELFSRLFVSPGRPFSPWHVPARRQESS